MDSLHGEEQLTLLMAPGARREEVSQDESVAQAAPTLHHAGGLMSRDRHMERCNALMDFVTNINDEERC